MEAQTLLSTLQAKEAQCTEKGLCSYTTGLAVENCAFLELTGLSTAARVALLEQALALNPQSRHARYSLAALLESEKAKQESCQS